MTSPVPPPVTAPKPFPVPPNGFATSHTSSGRMPGTNRFASQLLQQLLPLLLSLLQQLSQAQKPPVTTTNPPPSQSPKFVDKVTFDAGYPVPFTHSGTGANQKSVVSITYTGSGYTAILSNGHGMGQTSEPMPGDSNWDTRPRINGVKVNKVEYTDTLATYTLEDGTILQTPKVFKSFQ